jgi:hypothetical protein
MVQLKSRYDRQSVNQYILVSSRRGIRGVPSEGISIWHQEVYIKAIFLCYHWEGCFFKQVVFTNDKFKVSLRLTVRLCVDHPCGTCYQILFPVGMLLSEISGLVSVERPLWWEDGSVMLPRKCSQQTLPTSAICGRFPHTQNETGASWTLN